MQSSKVLSGFKKLVPSNCTVLRSGNLMDIQSEQLVVGDIVILTAGSRVPADIRLSYSNALKIDRSMLTGESEPVSTTTVPAASNTVMLESTNIAFMGTSVVQGEGRGIVIAIGQQNQVSLQTVYYSNMHYLHK